MDLITIQSDAQQISTTELMQACDLFAKDKVIADVMTFEIETKSQEPLSLTEEKVEKLIGSMRDKGYRIIAFFIPGNPKFAWRDETVQAISNGIHWCPLDSVLEQLGFPKKHRVP
jgi:hypothetical protein